MHLSGNNCQRGGRERRGVGGGGGGGGKKVGFSWLGYIIFRC